MLQASNYEEKHEEQGWCQVVAIDTSTIGEEQIEFVGDYARPLLFNLIILLCISALVLGYSRL